MSEAPGDRKGWKLASLALIPAYLVLIGIFLFLNIGTSFNPPILLLVFNSLFLGLIPLYAAYVAYRSFKGSGSDGVLLKGTGMLMLGLGAIAAGLVNYLPDSMNANVTVHNTSFCVGAFLQFLGILVALSGTLPRQRPGDGLKIAATYGGTVVLFCSFVVVTVLGMFPPFFVQGVGFSVLRELIITGAIVFFALASAILLWLYSRRREEFFFWYSIGLALIGIGLLAVHFPSVLGSPLGWVGRSAQYLGAVYVLIAFIALDRRARLTGISIPDMLSRFYGEAETSYQALVETATDAIVVFDSDYRVIVWNRAAEKMFGYSQSEAVGSSFVQLAIPDEFAGIIQCTATGTSAPGGTLTAGTPVEITARRKDRSNFPVELALSRHIVAGTPVCTCIIRDLTDRKKTEDALRESENRFRTIAETLPVLISLSSADDSTILFTNTAYNKAFGFSSEEIIGRKGPDVYYDPAERTKMIEAVRQQGFVHNYRLKAKKADGTLLWLLSSVRPILYNGKPAIIGASIDIMDLVRAEETLREAHSRTVAILEGVADTFYSLDDQWRFVVVNPAAEKAPFGRPAAEMLGKVIWELYPDLVGTRIHRYYLDAAEKQGLEHYEALSPLNRRWYEVYMKGRNGGVDVYMRDITGRRQAEEHIRTLLGEVQQEKDRLSSLVNGISDEVWFADTKKNFRLANPAALTEFALDSGELDIEKFAAGLEVYRPDGSPRPIDEAPPLRALRGEEVRNQEEMIRTPVKGEIRYRQVSANPVRDATGNIIGSVSVVRDITGLKNAEEALRDSIATLEAFIDASPGILNIEDEEFRYLKTDRMTPTYFGLNRQTIVGRSVKDLAPDFIRDYGSMMRSVIETGQPVLNVELSNRVPTKPDELTYWRASYFRVPLPGGKRGIGIVGVDITDRKKAEEELKRKNDDLNALNEEVTATQEELQQNVEELSRREEELRKALAEKEVLLSEIHHRVKNNLTAFISLLSLEGSVEDTPVGRDLKIDLQNRARSMALIHETLYRTQQFSEVDMEAYLTPLVEQIVNSYTSPQPIRIIVEAKGVSLDLARATPAGLIVNELVTNSFKHGFPKDAIACRADQKDPCTIGVRLTKKEGTYVLSVWDNGVGMAAGFDPLTAKSLGLKLVNFLAKHQMRAKVEVKTVKGTEFVFRFKARDHGA